MMVAAVAILVRRRRALLLVNGAAVQVDADVDLAIGALGGRGGSGRVRGGGDVHRIALGGRRHLDGRCHNRDCPRAHWVVFGSVSQMVPGRRSLNCSSHLPCMVTRVVSLAIRPSQAS